MLAREIAERSGHLEPEMIQMRKLHERCLRVVHERSFAMLA